MGIARWNQRFLEQPEAGAPLPLVVATAEQLPPGRALDLACGTGRNALWLAQQGWSITAVDGAPAAIASLSRVTAILADLEAGEYPIEESAWDLILITYYLQRDLFEPAKAGLRPGGTLIAVALLADPGEESKAHRLRPGELVRYFDDWEILHQAETSHGSRVAEVVARKPTLTARYSPDRS
jgi:tellurite methyltransferase